MKDRTTMMDRNETDHFDGPTLSPDDALMVDRLLQDGRDWTLTGLDSDVDHRTLHVAGLLGLLDIYPADDLSESDEAWLIERTMHRIRETRDRGEGAIGLPRRLRLQPDYAADIEYTRDPIRINWREVLGIAAVILIMVSITVPMLDNARLQARRKACCANLMGASIGLDQYANDYAGMLPSMYDAPPEGNWLKSRANSANLFVLAKAGYVTLPTLACPGNEHAGVDESLLAGDNWPSRRATSYAYQNQFGPERHRWESAESPIAVLADRNPHVDASCTEQLARPKGPDAISPCHGSRQNMLISDGSVIQTMKPYLGNDHIFLPEDFEVPSDATIVLDGDEVPVSPADSMLIQ